MKYKSYGFSLIELLVTIGILSLLTAIAIPNYLKYKEAPIKAAMKNELTELSKYLQYTASVDGGYHQKIFTMGYRPSKSLMSKAGFKHERRNNNLCCNYFSTQNAAGDYSSYFTLTNANMFDPIKKESATQSVQMCDYGYCTKTDKIPTTALTVAFYGIGDSDCISDLLFEFIDCDCDTYLIATSSYIRPSKIALMFTNEKGRFCYSDTSNEVEAY